MQLLLLPVLLALIIAFLVTPLIRKFAVDLNAVAKPNHRTIHMADLPKLGGLGIFLGFLTGLLFLISTFNAHDYIYGIVIGGGIMISLGFFDDLYSVSCYRKLFFQIIAAGIVIYFGFTIKTLHFPFVGSLDLGYFAIPLSLLWIVGLTNAINLLDGLDGLAAGVSVIIGFFIVISAGLSQDVFLAAIVLILIAATLGFFKYNFPSAKIFLGDTGSLFLGFCLACLSIKAFTFQDAGTTLSAMVAPFAVPLTDTVIAITRRLKEGKNLFGADKKHIHHRMLDSRFRPLSAVLLLYMATIIFGLVGLLTLYIHIYISILILSGVFALFIFGLFKLDCFDFLNKKDTSETVTRFVLEDKPNETDIQYIKENDKKLNRSKYFNIPSNSPS
jgi:UDP-GlcNAc:undecaprenyl-phosphate GlcNAc-1-phosphate transferase